MENKPVYIYALINPINNHVFYIGATQHPKERLSNHLSGYKTTSKGMEIVKILNQGHTPEMQILEDCEIEDAVFLEEFYMDLFSFYGFNILQNKKSNYSQKIAIPSSSYSKIIIGTNAKIMLTGTFMGIPCESVAYYNHVTNEGIIQAHDDLTKRYYQKIDFILLKTGSDYVRDGTSLINKRLQN